MKKEQVEALLEKLDGVENVGAVQILNEPQFYVEPESDDPKAITSVEFDHENELVSIMHAEEVLRTYGYESVTAIYSKEATRGMGIEKYNPYDSLHGYHNQSPNRKYGC